jgi:hypothetical protein
LVVFPKKGDFDMGEEIKIWKIDFNNYSSLEIEHSSLPDEYTLEEIISRNIDLIHPDLLFVGRQIDFGSGTIDILCLDNSGASVIIELKRDKLTRECIAQAIEYASRLSIISYDYFINYIDGENRKNKDKSAYPSFESLKDSCKEKWSDFELDSINNSQKILIVGTRLEEQVSTSVSWLSENGLDINAIEFKVHQYKDSMFLSRRVIISDEQINVDRLRGNRNRRNLTADELLILSSDHGIREGVEKIRKKILDTNIFYEGKTMSNFAYSLIWDQGIGDNSRHKDNFITIRCTEPIWDLVIDRFEKYTQTNYKDIYEKYKDVIIENYEYQDCAAIKMDKEHNFGLPVLEEILKLFKNVYFHKII